ncbi:nitrate reductase [Kineobactrum salinum]|uniref:Nitrate reductase n=1 Tax=Kineobactrum salinum TaxID=2708301 RepID=A0A6C0U156_9GAMM|nr:nitrate reductase [Kineobactrum salinum]QIB65746.1 nitrate reductase [Kineobactrum salinum]
MTNCNTTCPYCGVGCGVSAEVENDRVIAISGDRSHPANFGRLCVKGSSLAETLVEDGRLLHPLLGGERLAWDPALDLVADQLRSTVARYGPESVAFYLSGQLLTEDYYVANKLMKGFLGSANVDTNSRLCMSSAVSGYQRAFGADHVPCSYEDLEHCDLLVMVGSNAAWTHPVLYQRIAESKQRNPAKRIVVIDPRRTASCDLADLHLAPRAGSDGFLFAGLLNYLQRHGLVDRDYVAAHTEGFDAAVQQAAPQTPAAVSRASGLSVDELEQFYRLFGESDRVVTFYSQGINQSATGTDKCNAIINCHLATGKLGRPGCGPFSITGQPNAMGGREVGGLANQLAAHMNFDRHLELVRRFWQAPAMASRPGHKAVELFQAMDRGEIRFVWIMATNPAVSLPDTAQVRRALQRCEFVVVSDCVHDTDTAAFADLLLPACGWGEKDGTVTNSERCISRQRALVPPLGEARPDWWMVTQVARRLGFADQFPYEGAAEIFSEHARLSGFENDGQRDFDISALADLDREQYDRLAPSYWPCPAAGAPVGPAQGHFFTPTGRARFVSAAPALPEPASSDRAPLQLNTGRLRDQWHSMTRTGRVPKLMRHRDFFSISLNPADAAALGIEADSLVAVENSRGRLTALAQLDSGQPAGQLFCPIHWNDQFAGAACVSQLIPALTDPVSGQPQSKYTTVALRPLATTSWALLVSRNRLPPPRLPYWSSLRLTGGYLTLLADNSSEGGTDTAAYRHLLAAVARETDAELQYHDSAGGDFRLIGVRKQRVEYALFANRRRDHLPDRDWLQSLLAREQPPDYRLLRGVDADGETTGPTICSCWEVGEKQINQAIANGARSLESLGAQLHCGTGCGSCVPELKALLQAAADSDQAVPLVARAGLQ